MTAPGRRRCWAYKLKLKQRDDSLASNEALRKQDGPAFDKVRSFSGDKESFSFLLRYLTDIRDEVPDEDGKREIVELWKESKAYEEWKANLLSLIDRLEKALNAVS